VIKRRSYLKGLQWELLNLYNFCFIGLKPKFQEVPKKSKQKTFFSDFKFADQNRYDTHGMQLYFLYISQLENRVVYFAGVLSRAAPLYANSERLFNLSYLQFCVREYGLYIPSSSIERRH